MRLVPFLAAAALAVLAPLQTFAGEAGDKPADKPPEAAKPADKPADKPDEGKKGGEPEKPKVDAAALFDKAVAWQGRPNDELGQLIDLHIQQMDFKLWGENEVEGSIEIRYTAPDKVWFKIWTRAWWRKYWTNGKNFFYKTGATQGCVILDAKNKDDQEHMDMIREALRIARLVVLENHKTPDARFVYMGDTSPRGKPKAPVCHLVRRENKKQEALDDRMWFYLDPASGQPHCIAVTQLLKAPGIYFIHLSEFVEFKGVKLPTKIEIFVEAPEPNKFDKFLFASLIVDAEKGVRVRINSGIDDEIYDFERD